MPLVRIGKSGGLIINPEAIAFHRSTAVARDDEEGEDEAVPDKPARVPGVLATWWFHRFFDYLAYSLRNPAVYQNLTRAYRDIACVYAELEGE
jgi:hypothetical protein